MSWLLMMVVLIAATVMLWRIATALEQVSDKMTEIQLAMRRMSISKEDLPVSDDAAQVDVSSELEQL